MTEPTEEQQKQIRYWHTHIELIRVLGVIGIPWPAKQRMTPFWLRSRLASVYSDSDPKVLTYATELLDDIVALRIAGCEPSHNGSFYK